MSTAKPKVVRPGDRSKRDPFTICIVANPALEHAWGSNTFQRDPLIQQPDAFRAAIKYIVAVLFGKLPGQREAMLNQPGIVQAVRVLSLIDEGLIPGAANSLIALDPVSNQLLPKQWLFVPFLATYQVKADIVFAVSASKTHFRATTFSATDDVSGGGVYFEHDGVNKLHCYHSTVPGTVAIHSSAHGLTALHEFQHAISTFNNGYLTDLYADSNSALNNKRGPRPIPLQFGTYAGAAFPSDQTRDTLGYPPGWQSYHCALHHPFSPAIMDNYKLAAAPDRCENDRITRAFVLDRLRVKISR